MKKRAVRLQAHGMHRLASNKHPLLSLVLTLGHEGWMSTMPLMCTSCFLVLSTGVSLVWICSSCQVCVVVCHVVKAPQFFYSCENFMQGAA